MIQVLLLALVVVALRATLASPTPQRADITSAAFAVQNLTAPEYIPGVDHNFDVGIQWRDNPLDNFTTASLCLDVVARLAREDLNMQFPNQVFLLSPTSPVRIRMVSDAGSMEGHFLQWGVYCALYAMVRRNMPFTAAAIQVKFKAVVQGYISIELNNGVVESLPTTISQDQVSPDEDQSLQSAAKRSSYLESVKFRIEVTPLPGSVWLGQDRIFVNLINTIVGFSDGRFNRREILRFKNRFVDVATEIRPPIPPRPQAPYNSMKYALNTAMRIPKRMQQTGLWVASEVATIVDGENVGSWFMSNMAGLPYPFVVGDAMNNTIAPF